NPVLDEDGQQVKITRLESLLTNWYDSGNQNYCDQNYLKMNNITREQFIKLNYDENFSSKKAVLNMIGAETYYYEVNGEKVTVALDQLVNEVNPDSTYDSETTFGDIQEMNANYKKYVASGMNNYESDMIYSNVTRKTGGASIGIYMVILLLVLVAMATFRSPAVALMPDVTPKPLRSQGNAMINLCGGVGGAIAFLIYTVVLFGNSLYNYVIIFASIAAGMLLLLAGFLALVKERKLVDKCQEICKEYGIDDFAEENAEEAKGTDVVMTDTAGNFVADMAETPDNAEELSPDTLEFAREVAKNSKSKRKSPKEWWLAKSKEEQSKLISFWLILASIFMWFMGYNAISSNLSVYTTKALNLSAGIASIISGVSMGISAIAFIPVGYMAAKIGRRKSIIIGFGLAVVSFVLIFFFVKPNNNAMIPAVLFALFYLIAGFGLIIANVNTFPMVTELSTSQTLGQYTGYYYMATMSAQAITPFIAGLIMDHISNTALFMYSAICVVIAIVLMVFVKHGDSIIIGKGKKLTKEEKRQIRLDALDAD
ncbi:MAG: MFS transporter, partial [Clostridia bacterium]|nr:MFS transporter [Clostridia bacterium]